MTSNEFLTDEEGLHVCDMCGFGTPHLVKIQRHMVKSHGHVAYPEPPVLAAKWTQGVADKPSRLKKTSEDGKKPKRAAVGTAKKTPQVKGGK